jgi:hypothetical protein
MEIDITEPNAAKLNKLILIHNSIALFLVQVAQEEEILAFAAQRLQLTLKQPRN